jgi:hypothetical protein
MVTDATHRSVVPPKRLLAPGCRLLESDLESIGVTMVRIASFNVENLFAGPEAFRGGITDESERILSAFEEVNTLFKKEYYSPADKYRRITRCLRGPEPMSVILASSPGNV